MQINIPQFKAIKDCAEHKQLLHYTNFDVLKIILNNRTLKCNSLKSVNDRLECKRKGIENLTETFYVSCFCHFQYEVVPFWFMYGGDSPDTDSRKVLFRFKNFANDFDNAIESDWAFTSENKFIYFDVKNLFATHMNGISFNPIDNPNIENRQTIQTVRMFDIEYLLPDDEAFSKTYRTQGNLSSDNGEGSLPIPINDVRSVGKQKTIHWEYEAETRIQCTMSPMDNYYFDYILLRLKDDIFRDLVIVANPWAQKDFILEMEAALDNSTLPKDIKDTITVKRSELDGQIIRRK